EVPRQHLRRPQLPSGRRPRRPRRAVPPRRRRTSDMMLRPLSIVLAVGALAGCGGGPGLKASTPTVKATRNADGSINDQSRCDWRGKADREASETAGPGSVQPNVRRVYAIVGTGEDRHKVLVCREIDTNFDGVKDVVRRYNDKGESLFEEADAN